MKAKVTAPHLLVRFFPGGSIAGSIDKGTQVEVVKEESEWAIISYFGAERYALRRHLDYLSPKTKPRQARIVVRALNVRKAPNEAIVGKVYLNDMVEVLDQANGWCRINYKGHPAYVASRYVEFNQEEPQAKAKGTITIPGLNVRESPKGNKLGVVRKGEVFDILAEQRGWYKIPFQGKTGFVYGKYVQELAVRIKASSLNVRKAPGKKVIGKLKKDEVVPYLLEEKGWLKIPYENQTGYIAARYTEQTGQVEGTTPSVSQPAKNYLYQNDALRKIALAPVKKVKVEGNQDERTIQTIWNEYGNLLQELSDQLKADVGSTLAIFGIESRGQGFWKPGHSLIRFETHVFHKFWGNKHPEVFDGHFQFNARKRWTGQAFRKTPEDDWTELHTGPNSQEREWQALAIARELDETQALKSMSIGAPQILGSNYQRIGYPSPQAMFEAFNKDIRFHLFAFFDFLNDDMVHAMRKRDFKRFASHYNGSGQAKHYGGRMKDYYRLYKKLID